MNERRHTYDEQLPWLQPVDDEDAPTAVSGRRMLAFVLFVLAGAALVAATFFLLGRNDDSNGNQPEIIRAEPGPFKVKPADPGGLDVAGESETAFKTSAGEDTDAQLDVRKLPNPLAATKPAAEPSPATTEPPEPTKPEPAPSAGSGPVIQLGAFKNSAQADRAWAALSARFPTVRALNKMVVPFSGGVRLRASGAAAREACDAVRAGGENCFVAK